MILPVYASGCSDEPCVAAGMVSIRAWGIWAAIRCAIWVNRHILRDEQGRQ
jgi:hypothetical protein